MSGLVIAISDGPALAPSWDLAEPYSCFLSAGPSYHIAGHLPGVPRTKHLEEAAQPAWVIWRACCRCAARHPKIFDDRTACERRFAAMLHEAQ